MKEQNTLGQFIATLRKEKNLTQSKLGELLSVSDKTISRWENDLALPDMEMMIKLSEVFDVSLVELTNGKKSERKSEENDTKEEIKKISKLDKHINKILIATIFIILIDIIIIFFVYFYNNYNKYSVYTIRSIDTEYQIVGNVVEIPNKKLIYINSINNPRVEYSYNEKVYAYGYRLKNDGNLKYQKDCGYFDFEEPTTEQEKEKYKFIGNLSDILEDIHFYVEEDVSTLDKEKFYILEIIYVNERFEIKRIVIPLELEKIYSNSKFIYSEK